MPRITEHFKPPLIDDGSTGETLAPFDSFQNDIVHIDIRPIDGRKTQLLLSAMQLFS